LESINEKVAFCTAHPVVMVVTAVAAVAAPEHVMVIAVLPEGRHLAAVQGESVVVCKSTVAVGTPVQAVPE